MTRDNVNHVNNNIRWICVKISVFAIYWTEERGWDLLQQHRLHGLVWTWQTLTGNTPSPVCLLPSKPHICSFQQTITSVSYSSRSAVRFTHFGCQHLAELICCNARRHLDKQGVPHSAVYDLFPDGLWACRHRHYIQWCCFCLCFQVWLIFSLPASLRAF